MASAAKDDQDVVSEYKRPNTEQAFKIYDHEIKPRKAVIAEKRGDLSEPYSRIKDDCHFPRKVLDFVIGLEEMEEHKRDHNLLALSEALQHRRLFLPRDLATIADGTAGDPVIPEGERKRLKLATAAG